MYLPSNTYNKHRVAGLDFDWDEITNSIYCKACPTNFTLYRNALVPFFPLHNQNIVALQSDYSRHHLIKFKLKAFLFLNTSILTMCRFQFSQFSFRTDLRLSHWQEKNFHEYIFLADLKTSKKYYRNCWLLLENFLFHKLLFEYSLKFKSKKVNKL